jgi:hydroxypyruvate reductase
MQHTVPPPLLHWQEDPAAFLRQLFAMAVQRAQPAQCLAPYLPAVPAGRTVVVGAGKAAASMAFALEALWPASAPLSGTVVTRYAHTPPADRPGPHGAVRRIEVLEAGHPVPDAAGMEAAGRMLQAVQGLTPADLVIGLISGGGSALLTVPAQDMTLADKQRLNQALLTSGAHIGEMNCVRKHVSRIKGGRLAQACAPARLITLAISDVPGDDPATIASGPTVPDASTCADALEIIQRYRLPLPELVLERLMRGELETPKPGAECFEHSQVHLVATPALALQAAADWSQTCGVRAYLMGDALEGESQELGRSHAAWAIDPVLRAGFQAPCVLLSGGETTVTLAGAFARGGRASEYALGLLQGLQSAPGVWALAADTDGIDGSEHNAGVLVRPDSLSRAQALGLSAGDHLLRHDAFGFFEALGDLVVTGPTFTNVNDFRALLMC